jgi:hypothetical protein
MCNNGWMSDLETAVRPLMPMIKGYNASLTTDQQITVATWASMKTADGRFCITVSGPDANHRP